MLFEVKMIAGQIFMKGEEELLCS